MFIKKQLSKLLIVITIAIVIFFAACNKNEDTNQSLIPNVYVNFYLYPNTIDHIPIASWKYIENEGYRGIIIYRINDFTFNAYERTCPYDPQEDCARVEANPGSSIFIDSCCMSMFNIIDGSPVSGPATLPLKQYFTEYVEGVLHVYNNP